MNPLDDGTTGVGSLPTRSSNSVIGLPGWKIKSHQMPWSWLATVLTEMLAIDYPIVQGPPEGFRSQRLTAAESISWLGSFGAHSLSPDASAGHRRDSRIDVKTVRVNLWVSMEDDGARTSDEAAVQPEPSFRLHDHFAALDVPLPTYTPTCRRVSMIRCAWCSTRTFRSSASFSAFHRPTSCTNVVAERSSRSEPRQRARRRGLQEAASTSSRASGFEAVVIEDPFFCAPRKIVDRDLLPRPAYRRRSTSP